VVAVLLLHYTTYIRCYSYSILSGLSNNILTKYTEDGNGVAGAFINVKTWRSEVFYGLMYDPENMPVINSYPRGDSLSIYFFGEIQNEQDFQTNDKIGFYLKNVNVQSFEQLAELKGQKFSLDGVNSYGAYESYEGGVGQLFLKNVALNDSLDRVIISGTLDFPFLMRTEKKLMYIMAGSTTR
jgi:hypothetical protein